MELQPVTKARITDTLFWRYSLQSYSDPGRFAEFLRPAREAEWVVYAKRPFAGPEQVLDYLGRYTHRIAIGNQRLCSLDDGSVRFRYTDYRRTGASRQRTMTLSATEFIRRMLLHVLPPGFHRIRYYGFLANRNRRQQLAECRRFLLAAPLPDADHAGLAATDYRDRYEALTGRSLRRCPRCHDGSMRAVDRLDGSRHPGFVVTSPSTPARYSSRFPEAPGRSTCASNASRRLRDGLPNPHGRPPATGNLRTPSRGTPTSSTCRRCNTHRPERRGSGSVQSILRSPAR